MYSAKESLDYLWNSFSFVVILYGIQTGYWREAIHYRFQSTAAVGVSGSVVIQSLISILKWNNFTYRLPV